MVVKEVVWEEQLAQGDLVFTSGEGGWLENLLIGRISQIQDDEAKTFRKGVVEPFLNVKLLDNVFPQELWIYSSSK